MSQQGVKIHCGSQKQLLVARGIYVVRIRGICCIRNILESIHSKKSSCIYIYIYIYIHVGCPPGQATKKTTDHMSRLLTARVPLAWA